jgi:PilZ domain
MPLRYRASSDPQWREGHTENISRSGVLFRTDHPMPLQTPIEMLLALPVEIVGAGAAATVICRRRILRTEEPRTGSTGGRPSPRQSPLTGWRIFKATNRGGSELCQR